MNLRSWFVDVLHSDNLYRQFLRSYKWAKWSKSAYLRRYRLRLARRKKVLFRYAVYWYFYNKRKPKWAQRLLQRFSGRTSDNINYFWPRQRVKSRIPWQGYFNN